EGWTTGRRPPRARDRPPRRAPRDAVPAGRGKRPTPPSGPGGATSRPAAGRGGNSAPGPGGRGGRAPPPALRPPPRRWPSARPPPADGEAQAGAAVAAARAAVLLLEGLEDDGLLLRLDADAGVLDGESDHRARAVEREVVRAPARVGRADPERDRAALGELEGVRQQVAQDLLE